MKFKTILKLIYVSARLCTWEIYELTYYLMPAIVYGFITNDELIPILALIGGFWIWANGLKQRLMAHTTGWIM